MTAPVGPDRLIIENGTLVLPDRTIEGGALVIEDGRIAEIRSPARRPRATRRPGRPDPTLNARGLLIAPGFIDLHVHGSDGADVMAATGDGVATVAAALVRHGVTGFLATTIACEPADLARTLEQVEAHAATRGPREPGPDHGRSSPRGSPPQSSPRTSSRRESSETTVAAAGVLGAHLESNFLNPEYRGAQPAACLRQPPRRKSSADDLSAADESRSPRALPESEAGGTFSANDILHVIERFRGAVKIVTLAPELPGAIELVRWLRERAIRVSLGHSGADLDQARAAIAAGASHATHLFNRMPPLHHRHPGLAGAVLASEAVLAELICDGIHVHAAMARVALAAKGPDAAVAITDGTAGSGLAAGATAELGGQRITVRDGAAYLADGTLAGSVLSMDGAFRFLVRALGKPLPEAARLCAASPARALGLADRGAIVPGARADLVMLDRNLTLTHTLVNGRRAWSRAGAQGRRR